MFASAFPYFEADAELGVYILSDTQNLAGMTDRGTLLMKCATSDMCACYVTQPVSDVCESQHHTSFVEMRSN